MFSLAGERCVPTPLTSRAESTGSTTGAHVTCICRYKTAVNNGNQARWWLLCNESDLAAA